MKKEHARSLLLCVVLLAGFGVFAFGWRGWAQGQPTPTNPNQPQPTPTQRKIRISAANKPCMDCHAERKVAVSAIRDWKLSKHAENGVGCNHCHIPADDAPKEIQEASTSCPDKRVRRAVSARNCSPCHDDQIDQFHKGKHALAWVAMTAMPTTLQQPSAIIAGEKGCGGCHRIGRDEGKCDACHTRHKFSLEEARKPEACMTCHMGFDHPQWEMYSTSKHGTIYFTEGKNWDWSLKLADWWKNALEPLETTPRAPTCSSCHLVDGDHTVGTAWGFLALRLPEKDPEWAKNRNIILQALGVLDEKGQPTERVKVVQAGKVARLTQEEWQAHRDKMVKVCSQCHATSYAKQQLELGDQIIKECDALMAQAVTAVEGLYKDGILPRPKNRPFHVDLLRFYEVEYPIEQKLYVMFLEHRMRAFQGAFHNNPDYMHWYGWAEMKRDLAEIQHEAAELRKAKGKK